MKQKTIKSPVFVEGIGLQTGVKTKVYFKPSPANSGINFIRVDLPNKPLINIRSLSLDDACSKERRTTIGTAPACIQTTEHLLAALSGLSIDNILIESDSVEMPGLDGSAKGYVELIESAGTVEQDAAREALSVGGPVWCGCQDAFLAAFPYEGLKISYFLSYPVRSIGDQFLSLDISEEIFKREIAPARTFCMMKEAFLLKVLGFGKGAGRKNTLIMGNNGPAGNTLRFPDEPVRHKILDLVGDLCLVGMPLRAHVVAVKSGHGLNMELVDKIKKSIVHSR